MGLKGIVTTPDCNRCAKQGRCMAEQEQRKIKAKCAMQVPKIDLLKDKRR